jgi:8-oxo-dGTP diphosphatase
MPTIDRKAAAPLVLECARLVLRPLARSDVRAVVELAGDEAVATRTSRIPYPLTAEDAEGWIVDAEGGNALDDEIVFAIERREDSRLIGAIGLVLGQEGAPPSVGYWLGRPFWNQGFVTEAVRRLLDFAFDVLGVAAIQAEAFPDNAASIRVQKKVGLEYVGREMQPAPARGGEREVVIHAIRREKWRA